MESLDTADKINLAAGRGAILRVDFDGSNATLKRRLIRTASAVVGESFEGTPRAFRAHGLATIEMTSLGALNSCNTAFTDIGDGRLAISYDAGEPYEIDPVSLAAATPIGGCAEWKAGLPDILELVMTKRWLFPMVRTTAHPFFDEERSEFLTVNFGGTANFAGIALGNPFLDVVSWDTKGKLRPFPVVDERGNAISIRGAVHCLCVTRNFIVIPDIPMSIEAEGIMGLNIARRQDNETRLWIVRRDELRDEGTPVRARKIVLEKEWEHLFVNYADEGGIITLHGASSPATDFPESLRKEDRLVTTRSPVRADLLGMLTCPMDKGECGKFCIEVGERHAKVVEASFAERGDLTWNTALATYRSASKPIEKFEHIYWVSFGFSPELLTQRIYDTYKGYKHRKVPLDRLPWDGVPPSLFRLDCEKMEIADSFTCPPGKFLSSPQFLPRHEGNGSATDGYVMCTVASDDQTTLSTGDELWIADAENLRSGPVCVLAHPELDLAFTLHSIWMDSIAPRKAEYRISMRENYEMAARYLRPEVLRAVEEQLYPVFGK